jgi:UDP-N-acetylmuramoylalanine--D-glutamate ligase
VNTVAARDWSGKRVTVMGLGTRAGGVGVARFLAEAGALVTVTDLRSEEFLAESMADLADLDVRYVLGRHDPADFVDADAIVRNPGVRRENQFLAMARAAGVPIEMEMAIFLSACPAPVIGVTGTKGKTTTSAICGEMLRHWRAETVVAGNMGVSAVGALARITPDTPVVLELSSWQLEGMDERGIGPQIAIITNISEDHLDTYRDFDDYAETKRSIARHLRPEDSLILNSDDSEVAGAAGRTRARVLWVGTGSLPGPGIAVEGPGRVSLLPEYEGAISVPPNPALRGTHMRLNAAAAAAAALVRGAPIASVRAGLASFTGFPNRMEAIAEIDGILFVNDTAATAPAAAIAGLQAFAERPIHLIAGGADKKLDSSTLAATIADRASTVTFLDGTATPTLRDQVIAAGMEGAGPIVSSMGAAVDRASSRAVPGDVVLLSPGCASFGLFRDEFDRGAQFREAVLARVGANAVR